MSPATGLDTHTNDNVEKLKVSEEMRLIRQIAESGLQQDAFYVCNQETILRNIGSWMDAFPGVKPLFGK